MDVDDSPGEMLQEFGAQNPHESRKKHESHAVVLADLDDLRLRSILQTALLLAGGHTVPGDAVLLRNANGTRRRSVGNQAHDSRRKALVTTTLCDGSEIAAASGGENGNFATF